MTVRSEAWRDRAPSQCDRILQMLRDSRSDNPNGWVCSIEWVRERVLRSAARIWELRHDKGHEIEERICAEHKVAEYRLAWDAERDRAE